MLDSSNRTGSRGSRNPENKKEKQKERDWEKYDSWTGRNSEGPQKLMDKIEIWVERGWWWVRDAEEGCERYCVIICVYCL